MQQWTELTCGNVFLTGATGVLGAHLMKELLATTDVDLHCLVRAESVDQAQERLHALLRVYDPADELGAEFRARVKPVLGDIVSPRLGLSEREYAALAETIDVVIHGAALTNLFARFKTIEPINVGGTRQIVDFALATRSKSLCYISTYTVMGDKTFDGDFVFMETHYDVGQGFEHMTYQQSKFLAEGLVREASARGLKWKIVRPGQIFGESETGRYPQGQTNVSGLFYDIFKTVIESGVALYSDTYYDITPVDYVSKATVQLALRDPAAEVTFHLTNPFERSYTDIIQMIARCGYPITMVSQEEYRSMLFERRLLVGGEEYKSYTTQAFKWWFRREGFDFAESCRTDTTLARQALEPAGIRCPAIDERLLAVYIEHGIKQNYFPPSPLETRRVAAR